jgi:tRNA threonylcarbamoyl adenosine modification protein YjeE
MIALPDLAATGRLAAALAAQLSAGDVVCLDGPLGAGKTTLVRALVEALGGDPAQVASPTFTLLHVYDARLRVVHVDAYRLGSAAALSALGFDDLAAPGIGVIEWADRVAGAYDAARSWRLRLDHDGSGGRTAIAVPPAGKRLQLPTDRPMLPP